MRRAIYLFGRAFPYVFVVLMYHLFFTAYSHPSRSAIARFDVYGEAFLELVMLLAMFPVMVYSVWVDVRDARRGGGLGATAPSQDNPNHLNKDTRY